MRVEHITKTAIILSAAQLVSVLGAEVMAAPKPQYDQNVTPNVIFGSGNANGSFTTVTENGLEVGLRAKVRFPPQNVFNSNGDGTYSFETGDACPGFSFEPLCEGTPRWSFEWSINTDVDGTTSKTVGDFIYELGLDANPSADTSFTVFDNITPKIVAPFFDHAFGLNGTSNGAGDVAGDAATYSNYLGVYNVAQNSWNYEFFNSLGTSLASFDPALDGNYVIYLQAKDPTQGKPGEGKTVAGVQIEILVGDAEPLKSNRQFWWTE